MTDFVHATGTERCHLAVLLAVSATRVVLLTVVIFKGKQPHVDIFPHAYLVHIHGQSNKRYNIQGTIL